MYIVPIDENILFVKILKITSAHKLELFIFYIRAITII